MKLLTWLCTKLVKPHWIPKFIIIRQLYEPRPLPLGRSQFNEWSDRLISGANVEATLESQKWTLAGCLMHLGPTEDHKPDIHFIKTLRKFAVNQVADTIMREIKTAVTERQKLEDAKAKEPSLHVVDNMTNEKKV